MQDYARGHDISELKVLLNRGSTPHRTSLEDYVAYQWETAGDLLGQRHQDKRNAIALAWLSAAIPRANAPASILDVGCAYGNHLFMLNAFLKKPETLQLFGIDLHEEAIQRASTFANAIPGFSNCYFQVADLEIGLPFEDCTFDAVNLCDVIEHMTAPSSALKELCRVIKPNGTSVLSTPLKGSIFKRLANSFNRISNGRLYEAYYNGKDSKLNEHGKPIMETAAGYDHVSEMNFPTLKMLCSEAGFEVEEVNLMSVMSGSRWFDRHPLLLAAILLLESVHERLQLSSWAHSVMLRLRKRG